MNENKLEYKQYNHVTIGPACHRELQKLSARETRSMASEVKFLVGLRIKMLEAEDKMRYQLTPTFDQEHQKQSQFQQLQQEQKHVKIAKEIVVSS